MQIWPSSFKSLHRLCLCQILVPPILSLPWYESDCTCKVLVACMLSCTCMIRAGGSSWELVRPTQGSGDVPQRGSRGQCPLRGGGAEPPPENFEDILATKSTQKLVLSTWRFEAHYSRDIGMRAPVRVHDLPGQAGQSGVAHSCPTNSRGVHLFDVHMHSTVARSADYCTHDIVVRGSRACTRTCTKRSTQLSFFFSTVLALSDDSVFFVCRQTWYGICRSGRTAASGHDDP